MILQSVRLARRVAKGVARRLDELETKVSGVSHQQAVVDTMNEYDMVTKPDEPYYAQQYLHFIVPELESRFPNRGICLFDLGCGQGRLAMPLAVWCAQAGGTVTGVDLTPSAVDQARQYAKSKRLRNVTFVHRDAVEFIREARDGSADAILFTEVTFFMPSYREVLKELSRVLRPGGVAFIAFRSQYYNLLQLAWAHSWENAKRCLSERDGRIFGGSVGYAWQTVSDIHRQLEEDGLRVKKLLGIGILSGIEGDARAAILRPATLSAEDQQGLMEVECAAASEYAACGRYILTVAERSDDV